MSDHFIVIGESIHASIPKVRQAMDELVHLGPDAFETPNAALDHVKSLIKMQADEGADYIAVNVDAFGEDDPKLAVDLMRRYVDLVRKYSEGVPVCIDSSDNDVLVAGLRQWYNTDRHVAAPLVNSVKTYTMETVLPLKKDYDFTFVAMLMDQAGQSHSVDKLCTLARQIFDHAVTTYGFKPEEIFFDSTIFPLAIDMPMEPGRPGYTYTTFQTMRRIKADPEMRGTHFTGGISNCARDLPGRKIGVMRAFVHVAMEYGLDSAIANPSHHLNEGQPAADLLELVRAYADMDGSPDKQATAMTLMADFCRRCRKPAT